MKSQALLQLVLKFEECMNTGILRRSFIVIMERLGYEVKSSEQLLASPVQARQADVPKDY